MGEYVRCEIYLTPEQKEYISKMDKSNSEYFRELVETDLYNGETLYNRKAKLLQKEEKLKLELGKVQVELADVSSKINHVEDMKSYRPEGYSDVVDVLMSVHPVTNERILFQARRLGVSVKKLYLWLLDDGVLQKCL